MSNCVYIYICVWNIHKYIACKNKQYSKQMEWCLYFRIYYFWFLHPYPTQVYHFILPFCVLTTFLWTCKVEFLKFQIWHNRWWHSIAAPPILSGMLITHSTQKTVPCPGLGCRRWVTAKQEGKEAGLGKIFPGKSIKMIL